MLYKKKYTYHKVNTLQVPRDTFVPREQMQNRNADLSQN